jgi:hypothetical protein
LAWELIQKAGIVPDNYKFIIKGLIESAVKNLPKTHDENGKIII